ncbi:MAG: ArsC/Spx/MgsR family protein [Pseudomonadota bacterium]
MASLTLYGLKNCDTCKKAMTALADASHEVTFIDIRAEADLPAKLPGWLKAAGADALVNKRSTTWRGLSEAEKESAGGDGAEVLLAANPTLIKRPVIEAGDALHVGWSKGEQAALCP